MKKVLMVVVAGFFISASMISCNKCGECSNNTGTQYCQKDSKTLYDAAKLGCESGGGTWNIK